MKYAFILITIAIACMPACNSETSTETRTDSSPSTTILVHDSHSYAEPEKVVTTHLELDLDVNFDNKTISGTATHTIHNAGADTFIVDIKGLTIGEVHLDDVDGSDGENLERIISAARGTRRYRRKSV